MNLVEANYKLITPLTSTEDGQTKYNYVYQITEISTGRKYIGTRSSTLEPNVDIRKYQSSSYDKNFKRNQKSNKLNYHYEVLSYHQTRQEATNEECLLHRKYNVDVNPEYFNKSIQLSGDAYDIGFTNVVDERGNIVRVSTQDDRFINGELTSTAKRQLTVQDDSGNKFRVSNTDPRWLSGELKSIHKGMLTAKDKNGNTFRVSKTDSRLATGEIVNHTKGKTTVVDKNGKMFAVDVNDERIKSG